MDSGTTTGAESRFNTYACGAQNEGGPERVYKTLGAPTMLRARVYVDTGVDTDLHWLDGPRADACVGRADKTSTCQPAPASTGWRSTASCRPACRAWAAIA